MHASLTLCIYESSQHIDIQFALHVRRSTAKNYIKFIQWTYYQTNNCLQKKEKESSQKTKIEEYALFLLLISSIFFNWCLR